MNYLSVAIFVLGLVHQSFQTGGQCSSPVPTNFKFDEEGHTNKACQEVVQEQIKIELGASITYLAMSAHFSGDAKFRPGVAKFFLDSAVEERGHAKKMIEYILQRGWDIPTSAVPELWAEGVSWPDVETAIKDALVLEKKVTNNIREIIVKCEQAPNDYHTVDYFTGEFLNEQHESLRELSGHYATLLRMKGVYGELTEIIFDKTFA